MVENKKTKIFMSYCTEERGMAEDIANYLKRVFRTDDLEVFMASSGDSIEVGEEWQDKIVNELKETDAIIVLMSWRALDNTWVNFEIGVAWGRNARILMFCHKGLTPSDLPSPYRSRQSEDLNEVDKMDRSKKVAEVVAKSLNIEVASSEEIEDLPVTKEEPVSILERRSIWALRPMAHIGETTEWRFRVGERRLVLPERAIAAGLEPGDALYVRLHPEGGSKDGYINGMVGGDLASFFETVSRGDIWINAKIRLAGVIKEKNVRGEDVNMLLLVIDAFEEIKSVKG